MSKKFKILKAASKLPDSALTNFKAFRAGDRKITRSVNPEMGPKKLVFLFPFGIPNDVDNQTPVYMSERAFLKIADLANGGLNLFNLDETATGETVFKPNFSPAKATIAERATNSTTKTSGITGQTYKSPNTESYTIPFGQNSGGASYYQEVAKEIIEAVEAKRAQNSVTFQPEKWSAR